MEISPNIIFSYLNNYLLAATICFVGCFVREVYTATHTHTKISVLSIIIDSIVGAIMSQVIVRLVSDYVIDLKSEYYVGIYFLVGFWSDGILTLLYKRSTIIKFIRSIVANIVPIGKVIAQAWEDVEKDNIQTREERNNIKKNNKNKNTEKDCN